MCKRGRDQRCKRWLYCVRERHDMKCYCMKSDCVKSDCVQSDGVKSCSMNTRIQEDKKTRRLAYRGTRPAGTDPGLSCSVSFW